MERQKLREERHGAEKLKSRKRGKEKVMKERVKGNPRPSNVTNAEKLSPANFQDYLSLGT